MNLLVLHKISRSLLQCIHFMLVFDLVYLGFSKCWISILVSKDVKVSDSGGWRNGEIKVNTEALNRWLIASKISRTFKAVTWWTDIPIVVKYIGKYKDFPTWKYIPIIFLLLIFCSFFYTANLGFLSFWSCSDINISRKESLYAITSLWIELK